MFGRFFVLAKKFRKILYWKLFIGYWT